MRVDRAAPDLRHIEELLEIFDGNNVLLLDHVWRQWRPIHYLMQTFPKLHIDFSSFQANRAIEFFADRFGVERCVFGTGLMDKAGGAARGFLDWTFLPDADARKVAGGNLRRLLGGIGPEEAPEPTQWHDELTRAARAGKSLPCEIWDNHCHILHDGSSAPGAELVFHKGDADGMIETIRRVGIDKTAVMSWSGPLSIDTDLGNETVARAVERYPEEFIGLATVNPEHQSKEDIDEVIRRYHTELRFPGLKTLRGRQNINYDDLLFDRWLSYADEHNLYSVIDPAGDPDTGMIDNLCKRYPHVRLSLDHCGQSWHYARWAAEMVEKHGNVDAQLNYTNVTNGTIEYLVGRCGADRVLFGTDTPMRDPRPQVGWLVFTRLTEGQKRRVFGENFKRILAGVRW
jgi:predicted TIM-barrel fold metal-dependent hydrolase